MVRPPWGVFFTRRFILFRKSGKVGLFQTETLDVQWNDADEKLGKGLERLKRLSTTGGGSGHPPTEITG
jgi:hypothetical protein